MEQESAFTNLPPEIIINILSRLPIRPIIACKLVCKPWLDLVQTREFANCHLSKSIPGLVVYQSDQDTSLFKIFELKDEPDLDFHELHYDLVTEIDHDAFIDPSHSSIEIEGSADGLLFLRQINTQPHPHYICNPITREYIELPSPDGKVHSYPTKKTYGFGVSKAARQHKVVRILHQCLRDDTHALLDIPVSECHVYTLGTGSWRKIEHSSKLEYNCRSIGAFLNGSLHWLVVDLKGLFWISCFDLETESFSSFSPPRGVPDGRIRSLLGLFVLGDCLCLCDNTSEVEIVIWLMKDYVVAKSWTKEYVISKSPDFAGECHEVVRPIKVFADGDILLSWQDFYLFYYSSKTRTTSFVDMFDLHGPGCIDSMIHTSSFLSLNCFDAESVRSF